MINRFAAWLRRSIQACAGLFLLGLLVVMTSGAIPLAAQAQDVPTEPTYPCPFISDGLTVGGGVGASTYNTFTVNSYFECHYYDFFNAIRESIRQSLAFQVMIALLNTETLVAQQFAKMTADWITSGFHGGSAYWTDTWSQYLKNDALYLLNSEISAVNSGFFKQQLGFDICQPITLQIKLALGVGQVPTVPQPNCTFDAVKQSFSTTASSLKSDEVVNTLEHSVSLGSNGVSASLMTNQKLLDDQIKSLQAATLDRQEGQGLKLVTDSISGKIQLPSQIAISRISNTDIIKETQDNSQLSTLALSLSAFTASQGNLLKFAAVSFGNQLLQNGLAKLFSLLSASNPDPAVTPIDLTNPDLSTSAQTDQNGQTVADRTVNAVDATINDVFQPNLASNQTQDLVSQMLSCPSPRGLWGCSMDQGLATALQNQDQSGAMTVAKAAGLLPGSSQQLLHPNWELIPEWETQQNQDPGCAQQAYCSANLAKLRFARILPIGWELAANSVYNKKVQGKYVTLGTVIQNFNNCNAQGELDADHPWCHLINPAWPLVAPPFQCSVQGYTDDVIGKGDNVPPQRVQECTDVVSCLQRDDKGNCTSGYGYCLSDKTVWRFGADECDSKYATCRTYQAPSKQLGSSSAAPSNTFVSYVRNTVDYGSCNADNAGCMFYATTRDTSTSTPDLWLGDVSSSWSIVNQDSTNVEQTSADTPAARIYFDKTVQPCDASDDGCTKVYDIVPGQSALNLVLNGSFEDVSSTKATQADVWNYVQPANASASFYSAAAGASSVDGSKAILLTGQAQLNQQVPLVPLRNYVLSYYVRKDTSSLGQMDGNLNFYRLAKPGDLNVVTFHGVGYEELAGYNAYSVSVDCKSQSDTGVDAGGSATQLTTDWQRFTCGFVAPSGVTLGNLVLVGSNAAVDGVQLEEGSVASPFVDGINQKLQPDYLKIPPDELQCTGNTTTDRSECGRYAQVCAQANAGCQAYHDVNNSAEGEVPAILSASDYCPSTCVGYAQFQKQPSSFDLTQGANGALSDPNDQTTNYFIPTTGATCDATQVGCDEFTNVEAQGAGGETTAYFSSARSCLKPDGTQQTFYSWEGSDTTGYQLISWSLEAETKSEDTGEIDVNGNHITKTTSAPVLLVKPGPDGKPKDAATCDENLWKSAADPDCTQFYNADGVAIYRYYSQTITSSPSCTDFRKTTSDIDDCQKTGGTWNASTGVCLYHILASESQTCLAKNAGCRAFTGTTGANQSVVFQENFATTTNTTFFATNGTSLKVSDEALQVGDHSLQITKGNNAAQALFQAPASTSSLYTVSFWAKSPLAKAGALMQLVEVTDKSGTTRNLGSVQLSTTWQRFEVGPFTLAVAPTATIGFMPAESTAYVDTVALTQLQDVVYLNQNSWNTPAECDTNPDGQPQPQAMLGCKKYQDRVGRTVTVRAFSNLCTFQAVGCSAYVDTRNSSLAFPETIVTSGNAAPGASGNIHDNLYAGTVTTTNPGARYVYLVDTPSAHCDSSKMGCRSFGEPVFNATGTLGVGDHHNATNFKTVYLINDPAKWTDTNGNLADLCKPSELFCDAFQSNQVTEYFRDPGSHVCAWQDNVTLSASSYAGDAHTPGWNYPAGQYSGWFQQGSNTPCYPWLLSGGSSFLMEYPTSNQYRGYVALCPKDQSECTEYRDTYDHTTPGQEVGKPYYFIDNQKVDTTSCAGKVDVNNGCVLMDDTSNGGFLFSTSATYALSQSKGNAAVTPLDCANGDKTNPLCSRAGRCTNVVLAPTCIQKNASGTCIQFAGYDSKSLGILTSAMTNATCSTDVDCGATTSTNGTVTAVSGTCQQNDANLVVKVRLDRDCATWLGCSSGETVYDTTQSKYTDLCTNYAVCDQVGGSTQGSFCSHYVDRSDYTAPNAKVTDPYYEPVERQGVFLNDVDYSNRPVTYTQPDYTGYSLPDRFQVADLMTRRPGYELLSYDANLAKNYSDDYRLVAAVPLIPNDLGGLAQLAALRAPGVATILPKDPANPNIFECQQVGTKQIGYYIADKSGNPTENPPYCYLAVDTQLTQVPSDVKGTQGNSRSAAVLATVFAENANAAQSLFVNQVMPGAECKAYPSADAPFGNSYVTDWDITKQPNTPKSFLAGYDGVSYCERGEDCSCQFVKVNYGTTNNTNGIQVSSGPTKYYAVGSTQAPPQGICQGGDRDGQACIPTTAAQNAEQQTGTVTQNAQVGNQCGNGTCQPIGAITYERGIDGYCLQQDTANTVGVPGKYDCLAWDPTPVLAGTKDVYNYNPTAGYSPALNSGQYYCASQVSSQAQADPTSVIDYNSNMGAFAYNEGCVTNSYQPYTLSTYTADYYRPAQYSNDSGDNDVDSNGNPNGTPGQSGVLKEVNGVEVKPSSNGEPVKQYTEKAPSQCTNVDGSDVRQSQMAQDCGLSKAISYSYVNGYVIRQTDPKTFQDVMNIEAQAFVTGLLAPLNWNPVQVFAGLFKSLGSALVGLSCGVKCPGSIFAVTATVGVRTVDRASAAVPTDWTSKTAISASTSTTQDPETLRIVTTGEGAAHSYSEYFIPATPALISNLLQSSGVPSGQQSSVYESQIGYFQFHVPQPGGGSFSDAYPDETNWTGKMFGGDQNPGPQSDIGLWLRQQMTTESSGGDPNAPGIGGNFDGCKNGPPCGDHIGGVLSPATPGGTPSQISEEWAYPGPKTSDTDLSTLTTQNFGQLACLMSPDWVDGITVSDYSDESTVAKESQDWYTGFKQNFSGVLSRSSSAYLLSQSQQYLQQIPCQADPTKNCYYKYWDLGYRDNGEDEFQMFGSGNGQPGPVPVSANNTFFEKSQGDHPYFAIRAMFEDTSASDNQTNPVQEPLDGSKLSGPFKFVGFWVTAAVPGANSSRDIYMRVAAVPANICRNVAQVVSPLDQSNAAFTDRTWQQSNFIVPFLNYNYSTENAPFGAALHQHMIGHDPMLMLDDKLGINSADGTFVKHGATYVAEKASNQPINGISDFQTLSNLFARIYNVYEFYDVPVTKNDSMCFVGPLAGRLCTSGADCDPNGTCAGNPGNQTCLGGVFAGKTCTANADCQTIVSSSMATGACLPVTQNGQPTRDLNTPNGGIDCTLKTGDPNASDPDADNNRCTHGVGYYPRPDVCGENPDNVQCLTGLTTLPSTVAQFQGNYSLASIIPPTDVTNGYYAPASSKTEGPVPHDGQPTASEVTSGDYRNISAYEPSAPSVAAPDTSRECATPGQCAIAKNGAISVDNASEGPVIYYGSQVESTVRFYGWATDNQAPLTNVWVDWGDNDIQKIDDAKVKNHKPFCGIDKQCEFIPGLSCSTDNDCPAGAGKCVATGFCSSNPGQSCSYDADCGSSGPCVARLTYGNSPDDCEQNYFQFEHTFQCSTQNHPSTPCNKADGTPPNGQSCSETDTSGNLICHFVPRVFLEDNWGWCTGTCSPTAGFQPNVPPQSLADVSFKNKSCYDASKATLSKGDNNVNFPAPIGVNMCDPQAAHNSATGNYTLTNLNGLKTGTLAPWIPYQGYIEMHATQ